MIKQALWTVAFLGLAPFSAFAHVDSILVPSDNSPGPTNCTFPDGTHAKRAEIHCYDPKTFLAGYGIDQLHKAGITGKGQVIILADSFGSPTMQADLDSFSDQFGLPRTTIQFIYPNGVYVNSLTMPDPKDATKLVADSDKIGWAGETTLDLEWAHAIAPDATLVNIVTNVSETEGMAGLPELFQGIAMAMDQYPNGIVSMSFGTGEPTFTIDEIDDQLKGKLHKILQHATDAGMTLLAATGDNGTASVGLDLTNMMDIQAADYPAADPLITAVGGTALEYGWKWNPQGTIADYMDCKSRQAEQKKEGLTVTPCPKDILNSQDVAGGRIESVWKEDWALAAGGGGVSQVFAAPDYQATLPSASKAVAAGFRALPDLSMNAAINGGVMTYSSYAVLGQDSTPSWTSVGGTSAATPEVAALVALAGQRASDLLGKPVGIGSLNKLLYTLNSADFHDILAQSFGDQNQVQVNDNSLFFSPVALQVFGSGSETPNQVAGYNVTTGYDMATGLGTPVADKFVEDLAQSRVAQEKGH